VNRVRLLTLYSVTIELPVSYHCEQAMETSNFLNDFGSNFQRFKFSSLTNQTGANVNVSSSFIWNDATVWFPLWVLWKFK